MVFLVYFGTHKLFQLPLPGSIFYVQLNLKPRSCKSHHEANLLSLNILAPSQPAYLPSPSVDVGKSTNPGVSFRFGAICLPTPDGSIFFQLENCTGPKKSMKKIIYHKSKASFVNINLMDAIDVYGFRCLPSGPDFVGVTWLPFT